MIIEAIRYLYGNASVDDIRYESEGAVIGGIRFPFIKTGEASPEETIYPRTSSIL